MQKTKIEWCDYVWNITTGCSRNCFYCYAKNMDKRFKHWNDFFPTYHPDRLNDIDKLKKPSKIFVSSMGDLFDYYISDLAIGNILYKIREIPQHTFILLTKNPERMEQFVMQRKDYWEMENVILGNSITQLSDIHSFYTSLKEHPLYNLSKLGYNNTMISFEPLINFATPIFCKEYLFNNLNKVGWVILGGMTGPQASKYPMKKEWVDEIVSFCKDRSDPIPLFFKGWGTAKMKKTDPEYYLIDGKEYKEFPNAKNIIH